MTGQLVDFSPSSHRRDTTTCGLGYDKCRGEHCLLTAVTRRTVSSDLDSFVISYLHACVHVNF